MSDDTSCVDIFTDLPDESSFVPVCRDFFTIDSYYLKAIDQFWKNRPRYFGEAVDLQNQLIELYCKRMDEFIDGSLIRTFSTRYLLNRPYVIKLQKPSKYKQIVFTPDTDYILGNIRYILRINRLPWEGIALTIVGVSTERGLPPVPDYIIL
jgi:hypothetical protein